jgi:hypothetical protein
MKEYISKELLLAVTKAQFEKMLNTPFVRLNCTTCGRETVHWYKLTDREEALMIYCGNCNTERTFDY